MGFDEIVRRALNGQPQHVTTNGEDTVVVISAKEFAALTARAKYPTLRALLRESPLSDIDLKFEPVRVRLRPVGL